MKKEITIVRNKNGEIEKGIVTKSFLKRANQFGTQEYEKMQQFCIKHNNVPIEVRTIKKKDNKKSYKNLTYENMEKYIKLQENPTERVKEFEKVKGEACIQQSPYHYVLEWFLKTYKNYEENKEIFKVCEEEIKKSEVEELEKVS